MPPTNDPWMRYSDLSLITSEKEKGLVTHEEKRERERSGGLKAKLTFDVPDVAL